MKLIGKYTLGTNVTFTWTVLTNGEAVSLEGRDLSVICTDVFHRTIPISYVVVGNDVTVSVLGEDQISYGLLVFQLLETVDEVQRIVDVRGIELVPVAHVGEDGQVVDTEINEGITAAEISFLREIETNEALRIQAENDRVTAEISRVQAEQARVAADEERASRQVMYDDAEHVRVQNENARIAAERGRQDAEEQRETFELIRQQSEDDRDAAEQARVVAESARQSAEGIRTSAEGIRTTAENSRASAESSRVSAEASRVTAEQARQSAESNRASAESSRVSAENNRASAESSRTSAESARVAAESVRALAEQQREVVKAEMEQMMEDATMGEPNVQADWNETDTTSDAYILNKPNVYTKAEVDTLLQNVDIDVDSALSTTSENPVQNKVVTAALATKQDSSQLATINGSRIDQGGNVTIVAAEGQTITIDAAPTAGSNNAVSSGGVSSILNGGTETQTITRYSTLSDRRIPSNGSTWTASAATGYAIDSFAVTAGQTYHLLVLKMSSAYTAVYSFGTEDQGQTALPDPVIAGPVTNSEYDITIPSGITALFVCYQYASGDPALTTQVATEGLIDKVDDMDERLEVVEGQVSTVPGLNVDMYGGESTIEVEAKSVVTGYRMTNLGKITTSVASTSAVASYPVTAGETYRVQIPSVKNNYQAAYGFHTRVPNTDSQITLPSPAVVGPITNGDYSVTIPTGYSYLIVSYEFAAGTPTITYEGEIPGVKADVETLKDEVAALEHNSAEIRLPNKYYAVVGDVLQIFRRGVIKAANPYNHNVMFTCAKGANYPRYWRLYPTQASDVGTYPMTVTVTNDYGDALATAQAEVDIVSAPSSPASSKKFVCFGASGTAHGEWPSEAFRRLTGTGGTPAGRGLTNISFCGPKNKDGAGYFGVGGWSWGNYISAGSPAFRFQVSNVEALYIGATYTNNGYTYTIREVNVTDGVGNILCATSAATNTPTASGTLTKSSGDGDSTIAFSSASADASNPFWNYTNNQLDFQSFADTYCNGTIDCMVSMLGWNGRTKYETDFDALKASVRTFLNAYHTAFPSGKFILLGINGCSPIGGMGANYGSNQDYSDWYGMMVSCLNLKQAYQELANEDDYVGFVTFVDVAGQFDADYNLPASSQGVNTRNDSQTELIGMNGVHPSEAGYGQIADAVYRAIVALFCQGS